MIIQGKLIEIGNMDEGRGMRIETNGELVVITGLTEDECAQFGKSYGKQLKIELSVQPTEAGGSHAD